MIKKFQIYLDNKDISKYIISIGTIWRSKSYRSKSLNIDILSIIIDNSDLYFSPNSGNNIFDNNNYTNNVIKIYFGNNLILTNRLYNVLLKSHGEQVELQTIYDITKYYDVELNYNSYLKGNDILEFPAGEYTIINTYFFETFTYAVKHLLLQVSNQKIEFDDYSFNKANTKYTDNNCYMELFTEPESMKLINILNTICNAGSLYLYLTENNEVGFQHNQTYETEKELSEKDLIDISILEKLDYFNTYYIETDDWGWETDEDNNNVGAESSGSITAFADVGGGYVMATSNSHGLEDNNIVTIRNTTNYEGIYVISSVETNTFQFEATWVNTETGDWYARSQNKKFEILDNIVKVANSGSAIYLGEHKIKNNFRDRQGIRLTMSLDYIFYFDFYTKIKLNYFRFAYIQKEFEIFRIGINIEKNVLYLDCFEILNWSQN